MPVQKADPTDLPVQQEHQREAATPLSHSVTVARAVLLTGGWTKGQLDRRCMREKNLVRGVVAWIHLSLRGRREVSRAERSAGSGAGLPANRRAFMPSAPSKAGLRAKRCDLSNFAVTLPTDTQPWPDLSDDREQRIQR